MSYIDCSDWSKCTRCGECLAKCPMMDLSREEAAIEIDRLIKGDASKYVFKHCTMCLSCNTLCPEGLRPYELIMERANEFTGKTKKVSNIIPYMLNSYIGPNLFNNFYTKRLSGTEKTILKKWSQIPEKSKDVLFVGCIGKTMCRDIENSKVMKDLPKFGPPDVCCGELHYRSGMWDAYTEIAEKTYTRLTQLRADRIVFYCGACRTYLGPVLEKVYGKKLPFELTTIFEWLLEKYEKGEIQVKRPINYTAAVHDFCNASEIGKDFQNSLRKIYQIAGVNTVELEHRGDVNVSCGGGSLLKDLNLFHVSKIQKKKYGEVKATKAKYMAANCPGCYLAFFGTSWMRGIKVKYMPEELLKAFGDDITVPLKSRVPKIIRTILPRVPSLLKTVDVENVRINRELS